MLLLLRCHVMPPPRRHDADAAAAAEYGILLRRTLARAAPCFTMLMMMPRLLLIATCQAIAAAMLAIQALPCQRALPLLIRRRSAMTLLMIALRVSDYFAATIRTQMVITMNTQQLYHAAFMAMPASPLLDDAAFFAAADDAAMPFRYLRCVLH